MSTTETASFRHILYISDPLDLKFFCNAGFAGIYFGAEFCPCFLPSVSQLQEVQAFARARGVTMSLVTPPAGDQALERIGKLLDIMPSGSEVIFNDWGVYSLCAARGLQPVHGRLLDKIKKDPRLPSSELPDKYFGSSNLQLAAQDWLAGLGITRLELDNIRQERDLQLQPGLVSSLYYPYVPCSVSRHCLFLSGEKQAASRQEGGACHFPCLGKILQGCLEGQSVYLAGNVQFYVNPVKPQIKPAWHVDRLVYMPRFPQGNTFSGDPFYLDWNQPFIRYAGFEWGSDRPDIVMREMAGSLSLPAAANILDIGCGNGRHRQLFARSDNRYYGLDISEQAVSLCRSQYPDADFIHADITKFDGYQSFFHLAIDYGCLHTLPPVKRTSYMKNLAGMLRSGGFVLLAAWQATRSTMPCYYCYDQLPEWGFDSCTLQELIRPWFDLLTIRTRLIGENKTFIYFLLKKTLQVT